MRDLVEDFKELDPRLKMVLGIGLSLVVFINGRRWLAGLGSSADSLAETALNGDDSKDRVGATHQLGDITFEAVPHLRQVYADSDDPRVRGAALEGLAQSWDVESIDMIFDACEDPNPQVHVSAFKAIGRIMGLRVHFRKAKTPEERQLLAAAYQKKWIEEQDFINNVVKPRKRKRGWVGD